MSFFGELRRRNVFRMGVAYLAAVWVLIEVTNTIVPIINAPPWILQALVFSSALGFPLALVLAWFYEWTSEGIKAASELEAPEPVRFMGRKLDFAIIGLLVLAVGILLVRSPLDDQEGVLPNSVAVLPFENLSPDPNDAYFAAGLHDEILSRLGKLSNLSVISRTSMLRYADSDLSIPEIARELNVGTVMEGSVRYAAGRVRITTQLIDAATDEHLWSETYEREFSDIFAIESDIAMNVANALEAEFSLEEQESIEKMSTRSPAAYALYLKGLSTPESFSSYLDQAIALDPQFALAYAHRAIINTYDLVGVGFGSAPDEVLELERSISEDAEHALSIDPTLGLAHAALAAVHQANWRGTAAEQAFQRALDLSPNDVGVLVQYAEVKAARGERDEAIRLHRRALELDPNSWFAPFQLGATYRKFGEWDAAAATFQNVLNRYPADVRSNVLLAVVEAHRGNATEAVRLLQLAEQLGPPLFHVVRMVQAYALAGRPEEARRMFTEFEQRAAAEGIGDAWWATAHVAVGDYEQALERLELAVNGRSPVDQTALIALARNAEGNPELDKPEFRALLDGLWDE